MPLTSCRSATLDGTSTKGATVTNIGDGTFTYDPAGQFEALADR